jgi:thioredoxin-like negative regulator of GroEL
MAQQKPIDVLIQRAKMLDAQGRHDLAADNWRQVLLLDPAQPDGLEALASFYRSAGDAAKAQHYERLLAAARPGGPISGQTPSTAADGAADVASNSSLLDRASRLAEQRQFAQALALYRQVFGNTPPDNWAVAYYGTEAAVPSEQAHGIAGLRTLTAKYPENPAYALALAKVLTYSPQTRLEGVRMLESFRGNPGQNHEAQAAWRTAILWDPSAAAATETAKEYLQRYPDAELAARLEKPAAAPAKAPSGMEASPEEGAGYRALSSGNLQEAAAKFTDLANSLKFAGRGEAGLGYVSMNQKDFAAAVSHFEKAKTKGIHTPAMERALHEARYWQEMAKGNDALKAKDPQKAAADFAEARQLNARRPEATEALGGSLIASNDPAKAVEIFARETRTNPDRPDAWLGYMNALLDESSEQGGGGNKVLDLQKTMPADVRATLDKRADYLAMLLCAELSGGHQAEARTLLGRIATASDEGNPVASELRAAGLLFRYGYYEDASSLSMAALKNDKTNPDAWITLVQTTHMAGHDRDAIAIAQRMPRSVDATAMNNAGFLMALASVYQANGELESAKAMLERAGKLESTTAQNGQAGAQPSVSLQLQRASLAMAQGDVRSAYQLYKTVADQSPDQLDAWTGMLAAMHTAKHDDDALEAMHELPEDVAGKLRHDAPFLATAASIYSATGHSQQAMLCLKAVTDHYAQQHQPIPFGTDMQLAWLQLNSGQTRPLLATLDRLGKRNSLTLEQSTEVQQVWAAWSMRKAEAVYAQGEPKQALAVLQAAVLAYPGSSQLKIALAGMYVRTGDASAGMKLYQSMDWTHAAVDQYTSAIQAALTAHSMSYTVYWLSVGLQQYPNSPAMLRAGAHVEESRGHMKEAETYLQLAIKSEAPAVPVADDSGKTANAQMQAPVSADNAPEAALARLLAGSDSGAGMPAPARKPEVDTTRQLPDVDNDVPVDVQRGEQMRAGGSSGNFGPIAYYSGEDAQLIRVGASRKSKKPAWMDGDPGAATSATDGTPANAKQAAEANARAIPVDPLQGLDLGLTGARRSNAGQSTADDPGAVPWRTSPADHQPEDAAEGSTNQLEATLLGPGAMEPAAVAPALAVPMPVKPALARPTQPPNAQDELEDLRARYSPWLIAGGDVESHSGTQGFDHLLHYETQMGASTVLGSAVRLSVVTRPVLLQSGVPDSTSNYRFGSGGALPQQTLFASGVGASLQMAARTLQASIGASPTGFLVRNVVGNLDFRPLNGPFTFSAYRANQRDSLLSYAGLRDPATNEIWGGVVATGGSLQVARGNAATGYYASVDGQKLTGVNVKDNTRAMGNAGAYWLAYTNNYGDLKVGANITAMHYGVNERYFTIGQGGYFSPNAFLLMNAPITWEGHSFRDTNYVISGSLGVQSIQEGAAMAGSLLVGTGVESTTGASFDLHMRLAHHFDSNWTVEGFVDSNNARQYLDNSAGFTLLYSRYPRSEQWSTPNVLNPSDPLPLLAP